MSLTSKSIVIDIAINWYFGYNMSVRSVEFYLDGTLVDIGTYTAYATSIKDASFPASNAFNPALSKTGDWTEEWVSAYAVVSNQRLLINVDTAITFDSIVVNNGHRSGTLTTLGAQTVVIQATPDDITSTVYGAAVSNSTLIYSGALPQHPGADIVQDYVVPLINIPIPTNVVFVPFIQLYDLTSLFATGIFEQKWLLTAIIRTSHIGKYGLKLSSIFTSLYKDNPLPLTTFVQWYYDASNPVSSNVHRYQDVRIVLKGVIEKYGNASSATTSIIEKYNDADVVINAYNALYNINFQAFTAFVERYAITSNIAISQAVQLYSMTLLNPATATSKQLYSLLGASGYASSELILSHSKNANVYQIEDISDTDTYLTLLDDPDIVVSNVLVLVNDTEFVDYIDIEITSIKTSFFMECTIEVPDRVTWLKFIDGDIIKVINTLNEFTFMVRSKTREFASTSSSKYLIELESPTVKLIGPYAKTFSEEYGVSTARSIVESIASEQSVGVEWSLLDWTMPANTLYASDEFPIEVIKNVVHSAGGITQSTPEGNLSIIKEYPVSTPNWEGAIPVAHISASEDMFSITETVLENSGYNHYYVTDQSVTSTEPSLVTEAVTDYTKIAKLFLVPFADYADNIITLETTSDDITIYPPVGSMLLEVTETIWDELVEFKDGVGTLSNPCYGGIIVDPEDLDLGHVDYTEDGTLTVEVLDGYSEGYTLAKITYNTKYYKWTVTNNVSEDVQLFARIV